MDENNVEVKTKKRKIINTKKGSTFWTVWSIIEAILIFVGGILCLIYCDNKDLQRTILFIVGGFVIFDGALRILINFLPVLTIVEKATMTYDLVISGSIELAIGITLVCDVAIDSSAFDVLIKFISMFIGIALIVFGAIVLLYSIGFLTNKIIKAYFVSIIGFLVATCLIVLGALAIVKLKDPETFSQFALIIAGAVLICTGIAQVSDAIYQRKKYLFKQDIKNDISDLKAQVDEFKKETTDSDSDEVIIDAEVETKESNDDKQK